MKKKPAETFALAKLRRIIKEELDGTAPAAATSSTPAPAAPPSSTPAPQSQGAGLGKLIDSIVSGFTDKMKAQYPNAGDALQNEANDLKQALVATIKAAAAKVKTSSAATVH